MSIVPNKFPTLDSKTHRIAIIGEAPGRDEELSGEPFVGASGRFLKSFLSKHIIRPESVFLGNVCQIRPPANDIEAFDLDGPEIHSGLSQLAKDLDIYKPNICILLGKTAMWAFNERVDISNFRGSLFESFRTYKSKCLATYHPAACLRMYEWTPLFDFDLKRAISESTFPRLELPNRHIHICTDHSDVRQHLTRIQSLTYSPSCGTDIEGYTLEGGGMSCIAIAPDPLHAFVIPFVNDRGTRYFSEQEEFYVWQDLAAYLENPNALKIWQNGLYDRFVLQHSYHICVRGSIDDTMLQWHEKFCELPKGLDTQTSLLTREPYYKQDRKSEDWTTKMVYCGKDACVTKEINLRLSTSLNETSKTHYLFNRDLLNPLLYMELRGMRYNSEEAKARRESITKSLYATQYQLDCLAGQGHAFKTPDEALRCIKEKMCFKRGTPNNCEIWHAYAKAPFVDTIKRAVELSKGLSGLGDSENGELSTLLSLSLNVDSPKQANKYFYETLKLPIQINKKTRQPSTDYLSLLRLIKKTSHPACQLAIELRDKSTHSGMLGIHADSDGRIRCGYNAVGTNTGRLTCYTSPTGSGYNLQTIPKKDRDLFIADDDHFFFQCDLSGADGWTIAAHCKHLGDSTMYDDYIFGLKPAKILCLMLKHGAAVSNMSRQELKEKSKEITGDDWEYFMCKIGIWGSCYLMGPDKLGDQFLIQSEGKLNLSEHQIVDFQRLIFIRYHGVKQWHEFTKRRLKPIPRITAASGLTRQFFGRPEEILGEALAFEPQAVTTYATNKAVLNLWNDGDNRLCNEEGTVIHVPTRGLARPILRVEPLHQVHDALCGQFKKTDTTWAITKIKSWFANPIMIANQQIIIPFEGAYGESWGNLKEGII